MTARVYAQIVGVMVLLLAMLGLLLGEQAFLGILNIEIPEDMLRLLTGGILAYLGFGQRDEGIARAVVGALGAVYLLVGLLGVGVLDFIIPMLLGLLPHGYGLADNLIYLALGVLSLAVASASGSTTTRRA